MSYMYICKSCLIISSTWSRESCLITNYLFCSKLVWITNIASLLRVVLLFNSHKCSQSPRKNSSLGTNCDVYRCCLIVILTGGPNCKFGHSYVSLSHDPFEWWYHDILSSPTRLSWSKQRMTWHTRSNQLQCCLSCSPASGPFKERKTQQTVTGCFVPTL